MTATLDREVFTEAEAARLLDLSQSTLHYWLEGGVRRGVTYLPIIRERSADRRNVTWAEFVEAGWLRAYRRNKVPMKQLREFIEGLRSEFQVPYPLADRRPLVSGRSLVVKTQEAVALSPAYHLVDAEMMLTYPGQSFVDRITWSGDVADGWRPVDDPASTVLVKPDVRFGRPQVDGVSTLTIYEYSEEGASRQEIAQDFDLSTQDVHWALAYEDQRRAKKSKVA